MTLMISLLVLALLIQTGIFLYSQIMKKEMKSKDILTKYQINTRSDLFSTLSRNDIPEDDLQKLQLIYEQENI